MSKMSEMSFAFSLNVILSMSKILKIDQIHLRAVMLCMSKMSKMGKEHTHTFLYRVCDMAKMSEMLFSFLGGLSLHLNHLIASLATNYDWPFRTLPFGLFCSNLDTRDLEIYPRT